MLSILAPILVFGLVVFVHELGHFLAAKWLGVYAPRCSIGFGPALFRHRRGETEYILAAFPLGGYVRMASRHDEGTAFLEGGNEQLAQVMAQQQALVADTRRFLEEFDQRRASILDGLARIARRPLPAA